MNDQTQPLEEQPLPAELAIAKRKADEALQGLAKVCMNYLGTINVTSAAANAFLQSRLTQADFQGLVTLLVDAGVIRREAVELAMMSARDAEAARLRGEMLSHVSPILMPGGHNGSQRQ